MITSGKATLEVLKATNGSIVIIANQPNRVLILRAVFSQEQARALIAEITKLLDNR